MEENQPIQNQEQTPKEQPKKEKKGRSSVLVIIFAILAIASSRFGVYEAITKNQINHIASKNQHEEQTEGKKNEDINIETEETEEDNFTTKNNTHVPNISDFPEEVQNRISDFRTVKNSELNDLFSYRYFDSSIWPTEDGNGKYYLIPTTNGWSLFNSDASEEKIIKTQSDKIKYVTKGYFGHDDWGLNLLFINDKDQIEFLHLYSAFKNDNFETTVITDLENIIRFETVNHGSKDAAGSGITTLAEDKDGNFYNLKDYILNN